VDPRFGRSLRALRVHRRLRQADVGRLAGTSRSLVTKVESGAIESVSVGSLRSIAAAVGATVEVRLRWRGEALDRLLDERTQRSLRHVWRC
jgi:transcriptional regulator with XRE-family HTH domain